MRKYIARAAIAVAVVAAAALVWSRLGQAPAAPSSAAVAVSAPAVVSAPATAAGREPCHFVAGDTMAYRLQLSSVSHTSVSPGAPAIPGELTLSAQLGFEVLRAAADKATLLGRYQAVTQQGGAGFDSASLSAPFLVEVDARCQLLQFARHQTTPRGPARNQQALLWQTQFTTANVADFRLQNATGLALATMESAGAGVYRRTLRSYEQTWSQQRPSSVGGVLEARVGTGPWFDSLEVSERTADGASDVSSRMTLSRADVAVQFAASDRGVEHYLWENLLPQHRTSLVKRPITSYDVARAEKVAGLSATEALDAFVDRVQRHVGIQNTWPELASYFEVHPDAIRPSVQKYLAGEVPPEIGPDFFLALGKTRNAQARDQLLELKRDESLAEMDRVRAMYGLVVREDVGPQLAQEFASDFKRHLANRTDQGRFLATESVLALGTLAGSHDDPAITSVAKSALSSALTAADDTAVAGAVLAAIGNTGEPELLSAAAASMASPDFEVRKAAADAFGRMPPADSEAAQLEWLRRETNVFVKNKLYSVIQQQHFNLHVGAGPELVEQAMRDLPTIESPRGRRHVLRLLAQSSMSKDPKVREAIKAQAKKERAAHSTLFNEFANILTPDERAEVLR